MSPCFVLGLENVSCVTEVVKRSLKADFTDFTSCCDHTAIDCTAIELDYILLLTNQSVPISNRF